MRNSPAIRIRLTTDPRTVEQIGQGRALEQERADIRLEAEWRQRVAENVRLRIADGHFNPRSL
jgi:hypothetical protein